MHAQAFHIQRKHLGNFAFRETHARCVCFSLLLEQWNTQNVYRHEYGHRTRMMSFIFIYICVIYMLYKWGKFPWPWKRDKGTKRSSVIFVHVSGNITNLTSVVTPLGAIVAQRVHPPLDVFSRWQKPLTHQFSLLTKLVSSSPSSLPRYFSICSLLPIVQFCRVTDLPSWHSSWRQRSFFFPSATFHQNSFLKKLPKNTHLHH